MARSSSLWSRARVVAGAAVFGTALAGCFSIYHSDARVLQWTPAYEGQGNTDLDLIRAEIKDPYTNRQKELCWLRILALRSLAKYVGNHAFDASLDAEAQRYYREGAELADEEQESISVESALVTYYVNTHRPGKALPILRDTVASWERLGDEFRLWEALGELHGVYADLGEFELRDATWRRLQALEHESEREFAVKDGFWAGLYQTLAARGTIVATPLNNASGTADVAEVEDVWREIQRLYGYNVVGAKYDTLFVGAILFSAVDVARAKDLEAQALALMTKEKGAPKDSCPVGTAQIARETHMQVARVAGEWPEAARTYDAYVAESRACGTVVSLPVLLGAAESHEHIGDLDRAVELAKEGVAIAEQARGTFTVAERASIFRGGVRSVYWALMRALAKRSNTETGPAADADFLAALQTTEMVRARQLGELLEAGGRGGGPLRSLDELTSKLGPTDVVLDYTVMQDEILVFVVTKDGHAVSVVSEPLGLFVAACTAIAQALASPASDAKDLETRLAALGKLLTEPVRPFLVGKKHLIVLPDGVMNVVPFALLSASPKGYRALLDDMSVTLTPSLAYFVGDTGGATTQHGLFAMGDPRYSRDPHIRGESADALAKATRGSSFLGYFAPLPETRAEISRIAGLFKAGTVTTKLGPDATESTVKHTDFSPYAFVHFAAHGILGREVPGLDEPAIVLGQEPNEDGFLTATEARALHLNAKLTVLSACKTGAGDYRSGEGVLGMSRAFLLAGSASVLVSLWSVDSQATEDLMVKFYEQFDADVEPSEALRRAELSVRDGVATTAGNARGFTLDAGPRRAAPKPPGAPGGSARSHPFYWAPFQLVGH